MSTFESVIQTKSFNRDIELLSKFLILDILGNEDDFNEEELTLRKSSWLASLLASSPEEEHQDLAIDFGILAFHYAQKKENLSTGTYKNLLYIIAARSGNLPTLTYFDESLDQIEEEVISGADSILGIELFGERDVYMTTDGDTLSRFQKDIWTGLEEQADIAISGPTSSGKSHIVKKYIDERLSQNDNFEAVYLVPTRALITENASKLRGIIEDIGRKDEVKVKTGGGEQNEEEKIFYVLTPERCLNLLENRQFEPDLIFIDEIQNLGDNNRGVLYEIINGKLSEKWEDVRIIAAGPFLENSKELLDNSTGRDSKDIKSEITPVLQLRTGLTFTEENNLKITIFTPSGSKKEFEPDFLDNRTWNQAGNMKKTVPSILESFSRGKKSLIYCHKSNLAEQWAQELASNRDPVEISEEAERIIEHLEDRIHPSYPLIYCLRRGVAFHHGKVPELARNAIESMYEKDNFLETVVSTPTLLQGVNLPCQEIFIFKPNKGNKTLDDFDFQNLIGRVGRLSENLYGIVYGVEREGEEWIEDKMEENESQEITAATDKACKDKKPDLLEKIGNEELKADEDSAIRYTIVLLRHKYLRNGNELENYLDEKGFSTEEIEEVKSELDEIMELVIPNEIVFKSPSVDPIKQDQLFREMVDDLDSWIFDPRWVGENEFISVCRGLNSIFEFCADDYENVYFENLQDTETHLNFIGYVAEYAYMWLNGESYREIIEKRIEKAKPSEKKSTSIRKGIKTINDDARFVLVKYFKIVVEILEYLLKEDMIEEEQVSKSLLDIDTMLERGSTDYSEIKAMNAGLSRTMANQIDVPEDQEVLDYLRNNLDELEDVERISLSNKNLI